MEIIKGIGWSILVITILKIIHYKYFRSTNEDPSKGSIAYWLKDNWMDYVIQVGVSFMVVNYSEECITLLNEGFFKLKIDWAIPHFEDSSFYWLLVPIIVTLLLYKFARRKMAVPIQKAVTPHKPKPPTE